MLAPIVRLTEFAKASRTLRMTPATSSVKTGSPVGRQTPPLMEMRPANGEFGKINSDRLLARLGKRKSSIACESDYLQDAMEKGTPPWLMWAAT
jgi:hypothetical protein